MQSCKIIKGFADLYIKVVERTGLEAEAVTVQKGTSPMKKLIEKCDSPRDTILIVDDSIVSRASLKSIFGKDYHVLEADDGLSGLDMLKNAAERLAAVILDIVMPRADGIQVLRIMGQMGVLDQLPVFLITGEHKDEVLREAYELGAMDIIPKPVIPYVVERRVKSVIELFHSRNNLNDIIAEQRQALMAQAEQLYEYGVGMIETLSTVIEFKHDESGGHVRRLRAITTHLLRHTAFGEGLENKEIDLIGMAAITHDVGKIAIPDHILTKPGRLTEEEFEIMKTHTSKGADLLSSITPLRDQAFYAYAYDVALHHHERWDGKGYPDRLMGDEISTGAQTVALADVYDALVSKRCYKNPYSFDEAVKMIISGQCGAFNPQLLRCFLDIEGDLRRLYSNLASVS